MKKLNLILSTIILTGCFDVVEQTNVQIDEQDLSEETFSVNVTWDCPKQIDNLHVGIIRDPFSSYLEEYFALEGKFNLHKLSDDLAYFYISYQQNKTTHYKTYYGLEGDEFSVHIKGDCSCSNQTIEVISAEELSSVTVNGINQNFTPHNQHNILEDLHLCDGDVIGNGVSGQYAIYEKDNNAIVLSGEEYTIEHPGLVMLNIDTIAGGSVYSNRPIGYFENEIIFHSRPDTFEILNLSAFSTPNSYTTGRSVSLNNVSITGEYPEASEVSVNMGYGVIQYQKNNANYMTGEVETFYTVYGAKHINWSFTLSNGAMNFGADLYFPANQEDGFAYSTKGDDAQYDLKFIHSSHNPYESNLLVDPSNISEFWIEYSGYPF